MKPDKRIQVVPSTSHLKGEGIVKNVPGNAFNKHGSKNPIVKRLMDRFHERVIDSLASFAPSRILDVGCGEGRTTGIIRDAFSSEVVGVDLEESVVHQAASTIPTARFLTASAFDLPFPDRLFDVVLATEMLEHVDNPEQALSEMIRVARRAVVVTVPHEPWWRIANMARGRYLGEYGNTPGHVQHWSRSSLHRMLRSCSGDVSVDPVGLWLLGTLRR